MDTTDMGRYWTADSAHYAGIIREELASFRRDVWQERFAGKISRPSKVLDFGCGPGFFSILLTQMGHTVTGIDIASGMIAEAERHAQSECLGRRPRFVHTDRGLDAFARERFDVIVSRNVTWTLPDPAGFYRSVYEHLNPGGMLLVYDANWNLPLFDRDLAERCQAREKACIERFGSTFDPAEIDAPAIDIASLPLSGVRRPDWDCAELVRIGFTGVSADESIVDTLWDEKEKLVYGETPLFEISARKA